MSGVTPATRQDLLALPPERYLQDGYLGPDGLIRAAFLSHYATAASTQFLAAELSPQELALTAEAVRQVLPLEGGAPHDRAMAAAQEALGIVAHAIQHPTTRCSSNGLRSAPAP